MLQLMGHMCSQVLNHCSYTLCPSVGLYTHQVLKSWVFFPCSTQILLLSRQIFWVSLYLHKQLVRRNKRNTCCSLSLISRHHLPHGFLLLFLSECQFFLPIKLNEIRNTVHTLQFFLFILQILHLIYVCHTSYYSAFFNMNNVLK